MHNIIPLHQKKYYLFSIEHNEIISYFEDYQHVLWYFYYSDLTALAHNVNDKEWVREYITFKPIITLEPKAHILLDSALTVCSVDQLAKDIQAYQKPKGNPYRAVKRGTNKKRGGGGYRHNVRYYRNTVAYLIGESKEFPLNKRELDLKYRLYDWDNPQRSNSSNNWKLQKKKYQWEEKC